MNRDFPCFTHLHLLSSDLFSSELSRLSDSSLLCFSSVHIVGSLASKLPSIMIYIYIYGMKFLHLSATKDLRCPGSQLEVRYRARDHGRAQHRGLRGPGTSVAEELGALGAHRGTQAFKMCYPLVSYGHLLVKTGDFYGIIHSINRVLLVLI